MSEYVYINTGSFKGKVYICMVVLLALVVVGILVMKNTMRFDETGKTMLNILLAMTAVQLVILFYHGFLKKVAVRSEGLSFQSPLSAFTIPWNSIQSIGAYKSMRNGVEPIPFKDLDKSIIFGTAWIYCSVLPHQQVIYRNKKDITIVFPYRREILDEMKKHIQIEKYINPY